MSGRSRREAARHQRFRRQLAIAVAVIAVFGLAGLVAIVASGGSDDDGGGDEAATTSVSMVEMAFSPDPITVDVADARLEVVNDGAVRHSFVVPDLGKGTPDLGPGQKLVVDLTDQAPGEYYAYCDVPGHREAGMETTLILR